MRFAVDGVVEVLRIVSIDRNQRQGAEIFTPVCFRRVDAIAPRVRFAKRCCGELGGQIETCDSGFGRQLHGFIRIKSLLYPRLS